MEQVVGDYNDLARGVQDRVAAGQPVLFYAWTPNWTMNAMTPGEDVIWLTVEGAFGRGQHLSCQPGRMRVGALQPGLDREQHPGGGQHRLPG